MYTIEINTGNAAFAEGAEHEVARILRKLADRVEYDGGVGEEIPLYDYNGNRVGLARECTI